jgi:Spy/CpxP family protein refolding chaperone
MVNRSNLRAFLVLAGVFVGGAGTGVATTLAWSHHRFIGLMEHEGSHRNDLRVRALQHALDLTNQQRGTIAAILERQMPERRRLMGEMMQTCGEPMRAYKAKLDAEIRAVLNPQQQKRFDQLAERQGERLFLGPRHGPPGQ